jgi:caffeoyl-CoA O-methyltransferase
MHKKILLVILAVALLLAVIHNLTAQQRRGRGAFGGRFGRGFSNAQRPPVPANEQEKKILDVLEDMRLNQSAGMMNVPPTDGRLLRLFTEAANAKHVVEVGTSNGYSGIWFCLALLTTGGKLTTYEINEYRASLARENFKRAGVDNLVSLVEGDAHETVTKLKEPIDILFLDADKPGYTDYLNKLLPLVRPGGLILTHNVDSTGQDFIEAITTNPALDTVFQVHGLGVTLKKRQK